MKFETIKITLLLIFYVRDIFKDFTVLNSLIRVESTKEISQNLSESGCFMITTAKLKGHLVIRMCSIDLEEIKVHVSKTVVLNAYFC